MARIAVDFDDTLVTTDDDGFFSPVSGAAEALQALKSEGHIIVIHTCRLTIANAQGTVGAEVDRIKRLLQGFNIPFDEIHFGSKMIADCYIDDRAVSFQGNWTETKESVRKFLKSS